MAQVSKPMGKSHQASTVKQPGAPRILQVTATHDVREISPPRSLLALHSKQPPKSTFVSQTSSDAQLPWRPIRESKRLTGIPELLVLAARKLFEEKGPKGITVTDITREANVTRELFYYYFKDRSALVDAVIDDYVEDFLESVALWNETRVFGDTQGSIASCIAAFRRVIYQANGPRPLVRVLEELGVRDKFFQRVVNETADYTMRYILPEYQQYHTVEIEHVRETVCCALFGMAGLLRMDPTIPDEVLIKLVEQIFHLDMNPPVVA